MKKWRLPIVFVILWAILRLTQWHLVGMGSGSDYWGYQQYAQAWQAGRAPYAEFMPEYPPGAMPIFYAPLFFGRGAAYPSAFAATMAAFDLAAFLVVLLWAMRRQRLLWSGLLYLALTSVLYPVIYSRFDLAPAAVTLLGLFLFLEFDSPLGVALLAVAGAIKLWPLALAPLALGLPWKRGGVRAAAKSAGWLALGIALPLLPFLPRAGLGVFGFLRFHAARGIQIESTWSTIAMILSTAKIAPAYPQHEFGAFHMKGVLAPFFSATSVPALFLFALVPQLLMLRGERTQRRVLAAAMATVIGFLVGGKILSPQFLLWVVPLLALTMDSALLAAGALAVVGLTTAVYPYLSPALEQRAPGHGWALLCVGTRNMLLLALYAAMVARAAAPKGENVKID